MSIPRRLIPSPRWKIAMTLCAFVFVTPIQAPPSTHPLQDPLSRPIVSAWLRGGRGATRPVVLVAQRLETYAEISPFSYTIEPNGSLTPNDSVTDNVLVELARLNRIKVIPTIASGWETRALARILSDTRLRAAHIDHIMKLARQPGIDGIDLDYENLPPDSQRAYTAFVTALAQQLRAAGKILSVTVPPKTGTDDSCISCRFADYAALGAVADRFRVMAYEYQGRGGAPGPIAPVWWMRQVIAYAVSQVPRERVILGIHLYGYDWGGKDTTALWWSDVQTLRERYRHQIGFADHDGRGLIGESWMTYTIPPPRHLRCDRYAEDCELDLGERHTVWYVDARYVQASWNIVRDFGLGGIILWRPGGEDPAIWNILTPTPIVTTQ